jgi:hypothetical protein
LDRRSRKKFYFPPSNGAHAFCGRVPNSVLARRCSDFAPEKLREVYESAQLKVLD